MLVKLRWVVVIACISWSCLAEVMLAQAASSPRVRAANKDAEIPGTIAGGFRAAFGHVLPLRGDSIIAHFRDGHGSAIALISTKGRELWRVPLDARSQASSFAVNADTLMVLVGQYDQTRLMRWLIGSDHPLETTPLPLQPGHVAGLLPTFAGAFVLHEVETAAGAPLAAVRYPRHSLKRIKGHSGGGHLITELVDSAPRVLFELPARGVAPSRVLSAMPPWSWVPSFAAATDRIFVARGYDYRLDMFIEAGDRLSRTLSGGAQRDVDPGLLQQIMSEWLDTPYARQLLPDSAREVVRAMTPPAYLPLISRMFAAPDGRLAIVRADQRSYRKDTADSVIVELFDKALINAGRVALPPGASVKAFSGDHLILTVPDSGPPIRIGESLLQPTSIVRLRLLN